MLERLDERPVDATLDRTGGEAAGAAEGTDARRPAAPGPRRRATARAIGWLIALAAVLAGAVLLDRLAVVAVGRPIRRIAAEDAFGAPPVSSPAFGSALAALTGADLASGHEVAVLTDTGLFDRLLVDVAAARRSVTVYLYFCEPGRLGDRLAAALAERARAGVTVLLLADGFACRRLLRDLRPGLVEAGVAVAELRPTRWYSLHRIQHRNHARMAVVDGAIGYTGGFGVADEWIGDGRGEPAWRETSIRFTGPAVADLQAAFLSAWAEATGVLYAGEAFLPMPNPAGTVTAGLVYSAPGIGTTPAERMIALSIAGAERTLFIANAYFVPTPLLLSLLKDAEARSVDVRLLLPGPRTDVPSTRWAGRGYYGELLAAGVRIFEYQRTMMHAKTLVADGTWSVVGSMNLDNRSTRLNDEAALVVLDPAVGAELDSLFLRDLAHAIEILPAEHSLRPLWQRALERMTRAAAPFL
jgi:cardiolipin synthase